jgi:predicted dehydrogenase
MPTGGRAGPFTAKEAPPELDWDMWQGQTERHDFEEERIHGLFRWWWDYSEGTITDWGAHHFDIVQWALGMDHTGPVSIDGRGIGEPVKGGFTTFPSFNIEYVYANGVTHTAVAIPQTTPPYATERLLSQQERDAMKEQSKKAGKVKDRGWRNGVRFEGTDGWIEVARGRIEASRPEMLKDPLPDSATRLYKSDDHMANFVHCVETREQPAASADIGHRSATVCHLGAISCRLDRKLSWDPAAEQFLNDDAANSMRSRQMHEPWGYDKV